ncbi:hypothetical protein MNBD_GAMMA12-1960 [hydrothermal vent metagenome]|uniref:Uncharacterized protein n=1 Tax=hydrothermal vent metagenome TaxID=652676 RepID=A0A3B0YR68_9ZZZZ
MRNVTDKLDVADIDSAIKLLNKYAKEPSVKSLIPMLQALAQDIDNESVLEALADTWRNLGIYQGAVLTYVPFFYTIISDDIFGDEV